MKTTKLPAPSNATLQEKAAWAIYPDLKKGIFTYSQAHHRTRIIDLAGRADLSRRQKNEVAEFNRALEAAK
jgi:hypothetical protein